MPMPMWLTAELPVAMALITLLVTVTGELLRPPAIMPMRAPLMLVLMLAVFTWLLVNAALGMPATEASTMLLSALLPDADAMIMLLPIAAWLLSTAPTPPLRLLPMVTLLIVVLMAAVFPWALFNA